jgi:hypothetical protein
MGTFTVELALVERLGEPGTMEPSRWAFARLNRRDYFICLGLLLFVEFFLSGLTLFASASLLMFTARLRDIKHELPWAWPAFAFVGLELFAHPLARAALPYMGRTDVGYAFIALIAAHLVFAVALGLQRSKAA